MQTEMAIALKNLQFSWGTKNSKSSTEYTLSIPEWTVKTGEKLLIEGESGSGKTTLLNIISGIVLPQAGSVTVMGQEISALPAIQRDRFRANNMGVIFQQFNLLPYLTAQENIKLSRSFMDDKNREFTDIEILLDELNLAKELANRKAAELSIGQQQRVAVARALHHRPPLIIADEPTSALDMRNRDEFIELLLKQAERCGSTVLFVSHDQTLAKYFDRSMAMDSLQEEHAC